MRGTEEFWAGSFGDDYTDRNTSQKHVASNEVLFRRILGERTAISSVLELGANRGHNLEALRRIYPNLQCQAVEINER
ncbi:MAG: pseudaminic acid biosynthesis-associated methylase, partial [Ilumatobacteraceae bacterium]